MVRFERELAVSGIGALWLGRLVAGTEAGRTVLLRRMPKAPFSSRDCDALKGAAEAYSRVRHPSLVKLLGVVEQGDDIISVSEHLDGVRLCDLMRNAIDRDSPLPATVAVRVVLDAARATLKAHHLAAEAGLFPSERLFLLEGVFIAAFGGTLLTETGLLATLARFTAARSVPELLTQLAPEELDPASTAKGSPEVFSLGVLLWEALANRYLFSRESVQRTLQDLRSRPIASLEQIERCGLPVPSALAEVVRIATNRGPSERFSSVPEFVAALEDLPGHFLATEHQVANALREQAADLLKGFHVDDSQSALTVAFSEVPASRHSTRPPPDNAQDWEPPTFAQRRLVSSLGLAVHSTVSLDASEALRVLSREPIPYSQVPIRARRRKLALAIVVVVATLGFTLSLTGGWWRAPAAPKVLPDITAGALRAAPSAMEAIPSASAAAAPSGQNLAAPNLDGTPNAHRPPAPSDSSTTHPKKPSTEPSDGQDMPATATPAAARKPDGAYRPRQIAPYRPKGI